jgi:predicted ATPase
MRGIGKWGIMLESITFLKDYRVFKEGQVIEFKPGLNLLVGDQGTGKSSLLKLIGDNAYEIVHAITTENQSIKTCFFDFEKMNARTKSYIDSPYDVATRFASHGQVNNKLLASMRELGDTLILMDEPDMALSIRSIYKLYELLKSIPNQIICSVHNPLLIELVGEVLSLEHSKWMHSEEFIQSQSLE